MDKIGVVVDEEYHFADNIASRLRIEGLKTVNIYNATDALSYFVKNRAILKPTNFIVYVDIALAPGDDRNIFNPAATDDFQITGIVLVEELLKNVPSLFSASNTVLYTALTTDNVWSRMDDVSKRNGFKKIRKSPFHNLDEYVRYAIEWMS